MGRLSSVFIHPVNDADKPLISGAIYYPRL